MCSRTTVKVVLPTVKMVFNQHRSTTSSLPHEKLIWRHCAPFLKFRRRFDTLKCPCCFILLFSEAKPCFLPAEYLRHSHFCFRGQTAQGLAPPGGADDGRP
eukprot:2039885-Rhodomonas_salina.1